jgi:hypothetical protein
MKQILKPTTSNWITKAGFVVKANLFNAGLQFQALWNRPAIGPKGKKLPYVAILISKYSDLLKYST